MSQADHRHIQIRGHQGHPIPVEVSTRADVIVYFAAHAGYHTVEPSHSKPKQKTTQVPSMGEYKSRFTNLIVYFSAHVGQSSHSALGINIILCEMLTLISCPFRARSIIQFWWAI